MTEQLCPCDPTCNPAEYEGRTMLYPDEAWHNWYFNMKAHPNIEDHRKECYDCMDYYEIDLNLNKTDKERKDPNPCTWSESGECWGANCACMDEEKGI